MAQYLFFRPFALPPKTPTDRVAILRTALRETLEDPEFLQLAERTKMTVDHVSADTIYERIDDMLSTPPEIKQTLREIIGS